MNKYTFMAVKNLTLTVSVYAADQDDAEEQASEIVANTGLDEWPGADDEDELELIEEECEDDGADE